MSIGKSSIARAVRTAQQSEPEKRPVQAEIPAICTMLAPAEIRLLPDDSRSAVPTEALLQSVRTVGIWNRCWSRRPTAPTTCWPDTNGSPPRRRWG